MHKKLIPLLAATFLLSGCGSSTKDVPRKDLDPKVISQNLEKTSSSKEETYEGISSKLTTRINKDEVVSSTVYDLRYNGIVATRNSKGYIGFFNAVLKKTLVNNCLEQDAVSYQIYTDSNIGSYLKYVYQGITQVVDFYGNVLYSGEVESFYDVNVSSTIVNKKAYVVIVANGESKIFEYNDSGISVVEKIPDPETEESGDNFDPLKPGDLFVDSNIIDLSPYGHKDWYISIKSNFATVFNDQRKPQASIELPDEARVGIIGDKLLIQKQFELNEFDSEFVCEYNGRKYSLETYTIEYLTGKRHDIESTYFLTSDIEEFLDENGKSTTGLGHLRLINADRTCSTEADYILDKDFNPIQNVTGEYINRFTQLSNNYFYNTASKILYDSEMKVVTYLSSLNPVIDRVNSMFWGTKDGYKGALDFSGKVKIPFEFESLEQSVLDKCVIGKSKLNGYCRYNMSTKEYTKFSGGFTKIMNHIYKTESAANDTITLLNEAYDIDTYSNVSEFNPVFASFVPKAKGSALLGLVEEEEEYVCNSYIIDNFFNYQTSPVGENKTEEIHYGKIKDDARPFLVNESITPFISGTMGSYDNVWYEYDNKSDYPVYIQIDLENSAYFYSTYAYSYSLSYEESKVFNTTNVVKSFTNEDGKDARVYIVPANSGLVFQINNSNKDKVIAKLSFPESGTSDLPMLVAPGHTFTLKKQTKKGNEGGTYSHTYVKLATNEKSGFVVFNKNSSVLVEYNYNEFEGGSVGANPTFDFSLPSSLTSSDVTIYFNSTYQGTVQKVVELKDGEEVNIPSGGVGYYINKGQSAISRHFTGYKLAYESTHQVYYGAIDEETLKYTTLDLFQSYNIAANNVFIIINTNENLFNVRTTTSNSSDTRTSIIGAQNFLYDSYEEAYKADYYSKTYQKILVKALVAGSIEFNYIYKYYNSSDATYRVNSNSSSSFTSSTTSRSFSITLSAGDTFEISFYPYYSTSSSFYYFKIYNINFRTPI